MKPTDEIANPTAEIEVTAAFLRERVIVKHLANQIFMTRSVADLYH
jgi:hypothetical protein